MIEVLSNNYHKARKDYSCDACYWFSEIAGERFQIDIKLSEAKLWVKAQKDGFKIKKGQRYLRNVNKQDGELYTFRARPEIHELCVKYELYEE